MGRFPVISTSLKGVEAEKTERGWKSSAMPWEREEIGIIIEMKYAEKGDFDAACQEAMDQIETERYASELKEEGFGTIFKYGIACFKKKCRVTVEKELPVL